VQQGPHQRAAVKGLQCVQRLRHVGRLPKRGNTARHISQGAAQWIVGMQLSKWLLLAVILLMVIVLGFFLPPVSIILMTAPIILPPLKAAGFDLIWFGVVMTIVMEMGLIHPPVGLNIFVIKNVAPDIPLKDVIWGVMPFVALMFVAVFLLCAFPGIATGLPNAVMGVK
jgi:TRAP-type C4-dicarboxylate transport system permease large subunit